MARTVKDAASLLSVIAGKCPHDSETNSIPFDELPDYTSFCSAEAIKGVRIGIPRNASRNIDGNVIDDVELAALAETVAIMKHAGAEIVDSVEYAAYEEFLQEASALKAIFINADWKVTFEGYLKNLVDNPQNIRTVSDFIEFTKSCPDEEYPSRDIDAFLQARDALSLDDPQVEEAYQRVRRWAVEGGIKGAIEKHCLDALIMPTSISTSLAAVAGYPVINVPWGYYSKGRWPIWNGRHNLIRRGSNIPFGLSFIGLPFTEQKLVGYAYACQQLTHARERGEQYITPKTELADVITESLMLSRERLGTE